VGRGDAITAPGLVCGPCGIELPPNSKFCNERGAAVSVASKPAEYKQVTAGAHTDRHHRDGHERVDDGAQAPEVRRKRRTGCGPDRGGRRRVSALSARRRPCNNDAPGCPRFGHLVCEQMDNGLSSGQVAANAMVAYNLSKIMAASLVSGAIVKYCPWDEGQ
jgi:hypothetical protein